MRAVLPYARICGPGILFACLAYLCVQLVYLTRTEFNPDELQGALAVHRLETELPYRDFTPYKTLLGYYIHGVALSLSPDPWTGLLLVRGEMALLNTLGLLAAAWMLARRFRKQAVFLALVFLVCMSTFLERSWEIRSDMLAAWCGLAGLLLLLDRRVVWSGVCCGLAFCITQKAAYFVVASDLALAVWVLGQRDRAALRSAVGFNLAAGGVLAAYIGVWAVLASPGQVVDALFFSHTAIAFENLYDIRLTFWSQTLRRNPLFYFLALVALRELLSTLRHRRPDSRERILFVYAAALVGLGLWHKQPWPYYFVMLVPTLFVLHGWLFDRMLAAWSAFSPRVQRVAPVLLVVLALLPLVRLRTTLARDNGHQRHMMQLADSFLGVGESYVDGMDMLYHRRQAVRPLRWLDRSQLERLRAMSEADLAALIDALDAAPVKLLMQNWRFPQMPAPIREHLAANYERLWGNIHTYTPTVEAGQSQFALKFAGPYRLRAAPGERVSIDGVAYDHDAEVVFPAGLHHAESPHAFRLQYLPPAWKRRADPRYANANANLMEFRYLE